MNEEYIKSDNISKETLFNLYYWIFYYRSNIHRFVKECIGIDISPIQSLILYTMDAPTKYNDKNTRGMTSFILMASRGLGKTFITMLYSIAKCILFPGIKIKVMSNSVKQALNFIKKAREIRAMSEFLQYEINENDIKTNREDGVIYFSNGSIIELVVASENGRGNRANIIIYDESRLMDNNIVVSVGNNFLTLTDRGQPWARDPKYKHIIELEHNSKIFLTSIGFKNEWAFEDFEKYASFIKKGRRDYFILSLPYQFGLEANIINRGYIESAIRENSSNIHQIQMELEVIPYGESEGSLLNFNELNKCRNLIVPLIPMTDDEFIRVNGKVYKSFGYSKKEIGELRVLSMDIAVAAGRSNDNSVIICFRLTEDGDFYSKEVSYIEVFNGVNLDQQILRLKQLFYDLQCDYVVIDAGGALGINAMTLCGQSTKDTVRNKRYPGWKTINKVDKFDYRVADPNAQEVIYPIQVTGIKASDLQYGMLVATKTEIERKRLLLLKPIDSTIDYLNKIYNYMVMKTSNIYAEREKASIIASAFENTDELINEAISTQIVRLPSGRFTFDEKNGRKDRIIALLYGIYFISVLEADLQAAHKKVDVAEYFKKNNKDYHSERNLNNPFKRNLSKLSQFGRR